MELDVLGLLAACSYTLDCVEAELVHVSDNHSKRITYMSICTAEQLGIHGADLQDMAVCSLLHDNALNHYIKAKLNKNISYTVSTRLFPNVYTHCVIGEKNVQNLPFNSDIRNVIMYHHENTDGSGPFGKKGDEIPLFSRIIHLCDLTDKLSQTHTDKHEAYVSVCSYLKKTSGSIVDEECVTAFLKAFDEEHFSLLWDPDLDNLLWIKVPRIKQNLSFEQIKSLADFYARIIDYKSPCTSTHSIGVAKNAERLSLFMGFDKAVSEKMYLAGALHDIGKVVVNNKILEKPGRLTEDEFSVMKHHAEFTYYMLSPIKDFKEIRNWAAFHHERLDGSGYPFGLSADKLNTQERIMACADIYQALTEDRPYRHSIPHNEACDVLKEMADNGWLDPVIVKNVDLCFNSSNSHQSQNAFCR